MLSNDVNHNRNNLLFLVFNTKKNTDPEVVFTVI